MTFQINAQIRLLPPTNAARIAAQLRQQLSNVTATVNVTTSVQGQRNLAKANKGLKQVSTSAKTANKDISEFGKQIAFAGKRFFAFTIATSAVLKLVNAFKTGLGDAIKFERELIKISQVTGSSVSSLRELSSEISRLSVTFGTSSGQLIQASRILSQTGLSALETKKALEALAKSDLAPTFDNIINTTEGAIAIFRQFGIEAGQLEGALGSINAVASKFAVESSDIIAAVRRTGGAFAAAGGNLNELIGLFTSVRATTRESAESIATGFRTIFTRLQRVSTQNFLESLGINLRDIEGQFVGPLDAIRRLSTALKNLPGTDPRFAQIIEELGGFRQVSKVIPLIQQFETAEKALGVAMAGTSSLSRDAAIAQQSLAVQIQQTKEQFLAMIRGFADNSSFKSMIRLTLKLADSFIKVVEALQPLVPLLVTAMGVGVAKLGSQAVKGFREVGGFGFTGLTGKHDGGVMKFQHGGLVPGVGNRDTVPAKLTPGEYVIRKAAVQKIGADNLQFANKGGLAHLPRFALGGNFGAVFPFRKKGDVGRAHPDQYNAQIKISDIRSKLGPEFAKHQITVGGQSDPNAKKTYSMPLAYVDKQAEEIFSTQATSKIDQLLANMAQKLLPNTKIRKVQIPNLKGILGSLFEGTLSKLGTPYRESKGDDTFDFPLGIPGNIAQIFDKQNLTRIPIDAKSNVMDATKASGSGSLKQKAVRYIADKLYKRAKSGVKSPREYAGFKILPPQQAGVGGEINRPNAMLTPGEVVVDANTASQVGLPTLNYINRTGNLPKFGDGGATYGRVFKPKLTSRGRSEYGDVGRKKQYLAQLIEHLEKMLQAGELDNDGKRYLTHLKARQIKGIRHSRAARFQHRHSGQGLPRPAVFNKGGAFGTIKNTRSKLKGYASGGRVSISPIKHLQGGGGLGSIGTYGFAIAGISALIGTFQGLNETIDKGLSVLTSFVSQAAVMVVGFRTITDGMQGFGKNIQEGAQQLGELQEASKQGKDTLTELGKERLGVKKQLRAQTKAGQPQDPKLVQRDKELIDDIRLQKQKNKTTKADIQTTEDSINKNRKLQTEVNYTSLVLGGLAAGALAASKYLEKIGRAEIEAGKGSGKFVATKAIGGAAQGGIMGGILGANALSKVLGPGWGTLIGAAVGGGGGAIYGSVTGRQEAQQIRMMSEFNKTLKEVERTFKSIEKGSTTFNTQRGMLTGFIRSSFRSVSQIGANEDTRQDIFTGVRARVDDFSKFLQDSAKQSKSFEQFLNLVGQSDFEKLAILLDIPFNELYKEYQDQIDKQNELAEKTRELTETQDQYADHLRHIMSLGKVFDTVTNSMQKFETNMNSFAAFANESLASFKVRDESAQVLNPADFIDTRSFTDIITRDIIRNPALQIPLTGDTPIGQDFGADVLEVQRAIETIPGALLYMRNSISSFDADTVLDQLLSQFGGDGGGIVQRTIRNIFNSIAGEDPSKFLEALDNLPELAKKFEEGFKPTTETAGKIVKAMTEEKNRRLQYVEQLNAITQKELALRSGVLDVQRTREELMARAESRPTDLNLMQRLDRQRLTGLGVGTDPRGIGMRAEEARTKLIELQNKYSQDEISADTKLLNQQKKYRDIIAKSTMALEHLSDASGRAAVIMEKIERAQGEVKYRRGLLHRAASIEEPKQMFEMMMELRSARMAGATGTLDVVPMQYRSEVMDLFKDLAERNVDLDLFGGAGSSAKIYNQLLGDFASKIPGLDKEDIQKLMESRTSEVDILKEGLTEVINTADNAYLERIKLLESAEKSLINQLDQSIKDFGNMLHQFLVEQEIRTTEVAKRGEEGKLAEAQGAMGNFRDFQFLLQRLTPGFRKPSDDLTTKFAKNLEDIKKLYDMQEKRKKRLSLAVGAGAIGDVSLRGSDLAEGWWADLIRPLDSGRRMGPGYTPPPSSNSVINELQNNRLFRDMIATGAFNTGDRTDLTGETKISSAELEKRMLTLQDVILEMTGGDEQAALLFKNKLMEQTGTRMEGDEISLLNFTRSVIQALPKFAEELEKGYGGIGELRARLEHDLGVPLLPTMIDTLGQQFEDLRGPVATFKDKDIPALQASVVTFRESVDKLTQDIQKLQNALPEDIKKASAPKPPSAPAPAGSQRGGLIGFNKGGVVPGVGNRDTVPAMLTPGEVVIPKMAFGGMISSGGKVKRKDEEFIIAGSEDPFMNFGYYSGRESGMGMGGVPQVELTDEMRARFDKQHQTYLEETKDAPAVGSPEWFKEREDRNQRARLRLDTSLLGASKDRVKEEERKRQLGQEVERAKQLKFDQLRDSRLRLLREQQLREAYGYTNPMDVPTERMIKDVINYPGMDDKKTDSGRFMDNAWRRDEDFGKMLAYLRDVDKIDEATYIDRFNRWKEYQDKKVRDAQHKTGFAALGDLATLPFRAVPEGLARLEEVGHGEDKNLLERGVGKAAQLGGIKVQQAMDAFGTVTGGVKSVVAGSMGVTVEALGQLTGSETLEGVGARFAELGKAYATDTIGSATEALNAEMHAKRTMLPDDYRRPSDPIVGTRGAAHEQLAGGVGFSEGFSEGQKTLVRGADFAADVVILSSTGRVFARPKVKPTTTTYTPRTQFAPDTPAIRAGTGSNVVSGTTGLGDDLARLYSPIDTATVDVGVAMRTLPKTRVPTTTSPFKPYTRTVQPTPTLPGLRSASRNPMGLTRRGQPLQGPIDPRSSAVAYNASPTGTPYTTTTFSGVPRTLNQPVIHPRVGVGSKIGSKASYIPRQLEKAFFTADDYVAKAFGFIGRKARGSYARTSEAFGGAKTFYQKNMRALKINRERNVFFKDKRNAALQQSNQQFLAKRAAEKAARKSAKQYKKITTKVDKLKRLRQERWKHEQHKLVPEPTTTLPPMTQTVPPTGQIKGTTHLRPGEVMGPLPRPTGQIKGTTHLRPGETMGPLTREQVLYPKTAQLRKLALIKRKEMDLSVQHMFRDREMIPVPRGRKNIQKKVRGAPSITKRMQETLDQYGVKQDVMPKDIRVVKTDKAFKRASDYSPKVQSETRGFAQWVKDKIILRQGVPEHVALHELAHMIDYKVGPKGLMSYNNTKVAKLISQFRKRATQSIRQKNIPMTNEYFDYIMSNQELFADLGRQILTGKSSGFLEMLRKAGGFQTGAFVPGFGSGDKVPAMLEPGEFVLNRNAVQAAGPQNLDRFNKRHSRFQAGGRVSKPGFQEGGAVSGPQNMEMPDLTMLGEIMQIFGNKVDLFAESLNNINGLEIQLVATHNVNVTLNGLSVLTGLLPSIKELVVTETNRAITQFVKSKLPDLGSID